MIPWRWEKGKSPSRVDWRNPKERRIGKWEEREREGEGQIEGKKVIGGRRRGCGNYKRGLGGAVK